jgi:hypothetical protein
MGQCIMKERSSEIPGALRFEFDTANKILHVSKGV